MVSPLLPKRPPNAPPQIALGTMNFGKRTPFAEAERIIKRALEHGIRIFDTANVYNAGESERILGKVLGTDRHDVVIASKVGANRIAGKAEGLAPETIAKAFEESLSRLGRDHLDVYYLHVPDPNTPIERSLDAFAKLLHEKRISAVGVSNYASWQMLEMRGMLRERRFEPPAVAQLLYNALHRELEIEYFPFARKFPIHTTVYNPLAAGLLAGKHAFEEKAPKGSRFDSNALYTKRYWSKTMFARRDSLRVIADDFGMSLLNLSYAWLASRPDVDSVLVGPAEVAHLDDAVAALALPLPEEAQKRIDALALDWAGGDTHYVR